MSKFLPKWKVRHAEHNYIKWLYNWPLRATKESEIQKGLVESGVTVDPDVSSVFEVGCGACTNLELVSQLMPNLTLMGNDIAYDSIIKNVDKELISKIDIMGVDTETLFATRVFHPDLFMSIDHSMHLDDKTVAKMLNKIDNEWCPKYVLIREANKTTSTSDENSLCPRLGHDYNLPSYEMIYDEKSACLPKKTMQEGFFYFIRVFKRK